MIFYNNSLLIVQLKQTVVKCVLVLKHFTGSCLFLDVWVERCYTFDGFAWISRRDVFIPVHIFFFHTTGINCLVLLHFGILSSVFCLFIFISFYKKHEHFISWKCRVLLLKVFTVAMHLKWKRKISRMAAKYLSSINSILFFKLLVSNL